MEITKTYKSKGLVYGYCWGGGEGAYSAKPLQGNTKEDIIRQAEHGLDGSLDDGMGFESLIGALIDIEEISSVIIDEKEFISNEFEEVFVGQLNDKQKDFLYDTYISSK